MVRSSHPVLVHVQKDRRQSLKVRPRAVIALAASLTPIRARTPRERLTVGPRV